MDDCGYSGCGVGQERTVVLVTTEAAVTCAFIVQWPSHLAVRVHMA